MGYGMVVDGIAKFEALEFTFQGLNFPVKSLVLPGIRRIPQKFQALKFQNSETEIWQIHPPPFHNPPFACLLYCQGFENGVFGKRFCPLPKKGGFGEKWRK